MRARLRHSLMPTMCQQAQAHQHDAIWLGHRRKGNAIEQRNGREARRAADHHERQQVGRSPRVSEVDRLVFQPLKPSPGIEALVTVPSTSCCVPSLTVQPLVVAPNSSVS